MRTYSSLISVVLIMIASIKPIQIQNQGPSPYIYQIIATNCKYAPQGRLLTGFRVAGVYGIITALHGVADCDVIEANSSASGTLPLNNLYKAAVDIDHDVALLRSSESPDPLQGEEEEGLESTDQVQSLEDIYVIGHPYGMFTQFKSTMMRTRDPQRIELRTLPIPGEARRLLEDRKSPNLNISVLSIEGHLLQGHSGAPIFNSTDQVIGVGNGGLRNGDAEIVWAIPLQDIVWNPAPFEQQVEEKMRNLKGSNPGEILAFPLQPSLPLAEEEWLRLKITVRDGDSAVAKSLVDIEQAIFKQEPKRYRLSVLQGTALRQAYVFIMKPLAESKGEEIVAEGRVGQLIRSNDDSYEFQVEYRSGILVLNVNPVNPAPQPTVLQSDGQYFRHTVYVVDADTQEPIPNANVTLRVLDKDGAEINLYRRPTDEDGKYDFRIEQKYARYSGEIWAEHICYQKSLRSDIEMLNSPASSIKLTPLPSIINPCIPTPTPTTITARSTATETATPTVTLTDTFTPTDTPTATPVATETATPTAAQTATPTPTTIPTLTSTATATVTPADTATATVADTVIPTWTLTSAPTATETPSPSFTSTDIPVLPTPTSTLVLSTETPTFTATLTPMATPIFTPLATFTETLPPTNTNVFTATPTPSPSVTVASVNTARVQFQGLRLRSGPGTSYTILDVLDYGTELIVEGQTSDTNWLAVRLVDGTLLGWVYKASTNFNDFVPVIPPSKISPSPTPTRLLTPIPSITIPTNTPTVMATDTITATSTQTPTVLTPTPTKIDDKNPITPTENPPVTPTEDSSVTPNNDSDPVTPNNDSDPVTPNGEDSPITPT